MSSTKTLSDKPERVSLSAYFELFMNLTRREVKGRYSQSLFGAGWAIAQPLATMAVFTLVFARLGSMPSGGARHDTDSSVGRNVNIPAGSVTLGAAIQ